MQVREVRGGGWGGGRKVTAVHAQGVLEGRAEAGVWGWLGASPPQLRSSRRARWDPSASCKHFSQGQLNHLSVTGLQSWWERPRRGVLNSLRG